MQAARVKLDVALSAHALPTQVAIDAKATPILYFRSENEGTDGNALFLLQLYLPLSLRGSGHGEAHARGS